MSGPHTLHTEILGSILQKTENIFIFQKRLPTEAIWKLRACFKRVFRPVPGGETPPELAGEDACATYRGPLAGEFWRRLATRDIFKTRSESEHNMVLRNGI